MKKIVSCLFASVVLITGICFSSAVFAQTDEEETTEHIHNYISEITKEATYAEEGIITLTCEECGDVQTEIIPATGKLEAPVLEALENENSSFTLSWNKIAGATKYGIYIKQTNGKYKWTKTVTGTSFTTAVVQYGQKYTYKVLAATDKKGITASDFSNAVTVKNTKKLQAPKLKAVENLNSSFKLSWNKIDGAAKYGIYIKQTNGKYKWIKTVTGTSYTTEIVQYNQQYSYKVLAAANNNTAEASDFSNAVILTNDKKLQAPTLEITENENGTFTLSWNKIDNAAKYGIYVEQADGTYKWTKTVTGTSFTTAVEQYGKPYSYAVLSATNNNSFGASDFGNVVTATNKKKLQSPTLKAAANSNGSFKLSWNKITGATKYGVYIKQANGTYKWTKTVTGTSYTTAVLQSGKQFSYAVLAARDNKISVASDYSNVVNVVNDNSLSLNKVATEVSYNYSNVTKYVYGKSYQGRNLEAFIITPTNGKYKKTYVMTFAIHGFEDSYSKDGKLLVEEGNKLVKYYAENPSNLGDFRLVIVPCLNPDGVIAGKNNQRACSTAFGRCTANHIDMNRDFMSGAFKAKETKATVNLLKKYKPDVFTDFHGWLNGTYGTGDLCTIFGNALRLSERHEDRYGSTLGYIEGYVRKTYGCPSALIEYTSPNKVNHQNTYTAINRVIKHYS